MISCRELIELILEFDGDGLTPERRSHIEQHLHGCPGCLAYVESYRITVRLARQLPCPPLPATLEARLQEMLASQALARLRSPGQATP